MCDFCENRKRVKAEYKRSGITTCRNMIDVLFGGFSDDAFEVAHIENDKMWVDNSSGEYAELGFKISYCPFCGAQMMRGKQDERIN